jgi:hypothetical protein
LKVTSTGIKLSVCMETTITAARFRRKNFQGGGQ